MKYWLPLFLAMLLTLAACDPAATTSLLVRPVSPLPENLQAPVALQQIEFIGTLLQAKGFTKESYENPHVPLDSQKRILVECGHLSHWMQVANHHTTYAHVCLNSRGLQVSLVDYLSVTASPATQALAKELAAKISASLKNVRVEFSQ